MIIDDRDWYWRHGLCPDCEREVETNVAPDDRECPHCAGDTWRGEEKANYERDIMDRIQKELKR